MIVAFILAPQTPLIVTAWIVSPGDGLEVLSADCTLATSSILQRSHCWYRFRCLLPARAGGALGVISDGPSCCSFWQAAR